MHVCVVCALYFWADLESASKGGIDPDGEGTSQIAGDVLWSDPAPDVEGLIPNDNRGIGTMVRN